MPPSPTRAQRLAELPALIGAPPTASPWRVVDQSMIDRFADLTGDDFWIHVDVERADRERGGTIAHGFLVLSMMASLAYDNFGQELMSGLNYGFDKVRFTAPVKVGDRIRLTQVLLGIDEREAGLLLRWDARIEVEGAPRPAIVAEWLAMVFR